MNGFVSVLILISTLFAIVFVKMEIRRMGYEVLHLQRIFAQKQQHQRKIKTEYARLQKPDYVREHAKSLLELDWAKSKQIIYLTGYSVKESQKSSVVSHEKTKSHRESRPLRAAPEKFQVERRAGR